MQTLAEARKHAGLRQVRIYDELIIDNFAGGGGASTGIELALGRAIDVAINHDPEAVFLHSTNHPFTQHYCESVFDVDPSDICAGRPVGLAWFSPDCKHFSKAKGGKPLSKKIRALAWIVLKWAKAVAPRVIFLENVEEFVTWGPLLPSGEPCERRKGQTFKAFVSAIRRCGYQVEYKELRACDYGAPTVRKRFFMIARNDGRPIVWPEPTHGDPKSEAVKSGALKPWRTAAECIDWSLPVESIFERKHPLVENTLRRIAHGIRKYVLGNQKPFIVCSNHAGEGFRGQGVDEPFKTLTASRDDLRLVQPVIAPKAELDAAVLLQSGYGERQGQEPRVLDINKPLGTAVNGQKHALTTVHLMHYRDMPGNQPRPTDLDAPAPTITAGGGTQALVTTHAIQVGALMKNYGGFCKVENTGVDLNAPLSTVTTQDHHSLIVGNLVKLRGTSNSASLDDPMPTLTSGGTHIAQVLAFLSRYNGKPEKGEGQELSDPMDTPTTRDRFALITLTIEGAEYVIVDIGFRMLQPHELFKAQGFPEDYEIAPMYKGAPLTKTAQVRMCGNSVCPPVAAALVSANYKPAEVAKPRRKRA
jgi:DNA (cytosine-5)-methyltransferase 1